MQPADSSSGVAQRDKNLAIIAGEAVFQMRISNTVDHAKGACKVGPSKHTISRRPKT